VVGDDAGPAADVEDFVGEVDRGVDDVVVHEFTEAEGLLVQRRSCSMELCGV
jgi:hypothetical protein